MIETVNGVVNTGGAGNEQWWSSDIARMFSVSLTQNERLQLGFVQLLLIHNIFQHCNLVAKSFCHHLTVNNIAVTASVYILQVL